MPKTLSYRPELIDGFISNDRINSYQTVFHPRNDVELMGAYLWNAHVSGLLVPLIGAAEVALRNAIDHPLKSSLGPFWWSWPGLRFKSYVPGMLPANFPFAVKAVRESFSKATDSYQKERKKRYRITGAIAPTHNGVIAKTDFSTWQFLLDNEFMGNRLIWPQHLGQVFRGAWPTATASTTLRYAQDLAMTVREFRNRLFHHEPAWKAYAVHNEADAIAHVREKIDKMISLLALIHPENVRLLEKNGFLSAAKRACSSAEIRRFQHLATVHKVKTVSRLGALADQCSTSGSVLRVRVYQGRTQSFWMLPVK